MSRRGLFGVGWVWAAALGCAFTSAGSPVNNNMLGSDTEDDAASTMGDDDGGSAGDDGGSAVDDGAEVGDDEGDPPPVQGNAQLVFVAAPEVDVGELPLDGSVVTQLAVENLGDGSATALAATISAPPLQFEGGAYPGTSGTCGAQLDPGESCQIAVVAAGGPLGPGVSELSLSYDDAGDLEYALLNVAFDAIGQSENLLLNGGAEDGQIGQTPPSWVVLTGPSWATTEMNTFEGAKAIVAGWVGDGQVASLRQDVDLAQYAELIDAGMAGVDFQGMHKASEPSNDPMWFRVANIDGSGTENGAATSSEDTPVNWAPLSHTRPLPPGTRRFRVELHCRHQFGNACTGWFDALSVRVLYPPPS